MSPSRQPPHWNTASENCHSIALSTPLSPKYNIRKPPTTISSPSRTPPQRPPTTTSSPSRTPPTTSTNYHLIAFSNSPSSEYGPITANLNRSPVNNEEATRRTSAAETLSIAVMISSGVLASSCKSSNFASK